MSKTYGGEYETKEERYIDLGIRYYAVYFPNHRRRQRCDRNPLEVYELVNGSYQRLWGEPVWLQEVGLGLGRARDVHQRWEREWLYWYDKTGNRLLTPEETAKQATAHAAQAEAAAAQASIRATAAEQAAAMAEEKAAKLAAKLKDLGLNPYDL